MDREVTLFDGRRVRIICDDDKIVETINAVMVKPFEEALNMAWLSNNMAEKRAKNYMDFAALLMIREPDTHGVMSEKKSANVQQIEVPVEKVDDLRNIVDRVMNERPDKKKVSTSHPKRDLIGSKS